MNAFTNDIPTSIAHAAHYGTSFVPEKRAEQAREGYAETLTTDQAELAAMCRDDAERATLEIEFARYHEGYRRRTLAYLQSRSRLVSVMIAGPSKFPAARMNKRGEVSHKRLTELLEFRERALAAIRRTLRPELRPIMSGDADAVDRLQSEIRQAERRQEAMKAANGIIRRKPKNEETPEKLAELMTTLGMSEGEARRLFAADFCGRIGFPDYKLTNNGANIRRMKERLERIARAKEQADTTIKGEHARIEDCPADNRVRLFFPGKPAAEVREKLKSRGFRWTPSLGCWQAYRNSTTAQVALEVAGAAPP